MKRELYFVGWFWLEMYFGSCKCMGNKIFIIGEFVVVRMVYLFGLMKLARKDNVRICSCLGCVYEFWVCFKLVLRYF